MFPDGRTLPPARPVRARSTRAQAATFPGSLRPGPRLIRKHRPPLRACSPLGHAPPSLTLHSVAPVSSASTRCSALRPPAGPLPGGGSFSVPTDGEGGVKCRPVGLLPCSDSPERPPRSHDSDKNLQLAPVSRVARPRLSSCHSSCPGPPLWPAVSSAGTSPGSPAWRQPLPPAALCGPGLTDTASSRHRAGLLPSAQRGEARAPPWRPARGRGGRAGRTPRLQAPSPAPHPRRPLDRSSHQSRAVAVALGRTLPLARPLPAPPWPPPTPWKTLENAGRVLTAEGRAGFPLRLLPARAPGTWHTPSCVRSSGFCFAESVTCSRVKCHCFRETS